MNDPAILLDFSIPFDDNKLLLLDNVVNVMYTGTPNDVSIRILHTQIVIIWMGVRMEILAIIYIT